MHYRHKILTTTIGRRCSSYNNSADLRKSGQLARVALGLVLTVGVLVTTQQVFAVIMGDEELRKHIQIRNRYYIVK
jgi:hypothetical protein